MVKFPLFGAAFQNLAETQTLNKISWEKFDSSSQRVRKLGFFGFFGCLFDKGLNPTVTFRILEPKKEFSLHGSDVSHVRGLYRSWPSLST